MKLYIVTGTSQGLGYAIVKGLVQKKESKVYSLSRNDNVSELGAIHIKTDISNINEVKKTFNKIFEDEKGNIYSEYVLINNAGALEPLNFIQNVDLEIASRNIDVNLKGVIYTISLFIKNLVNTQEEKLIVNISSGAAQTPSPTMSIYNASKAGVEMLTKSFALEQEYLKYPSKIIAFQPGKVETLMQEIVRSKPEREFPIKNLFVEAKKNGDVKSPEFVAEVLLNLIESSNVKNGEIYKARDLLKSK